MIKGRTCYNGIKQRAYIKKKIMPPIGVHICYYDNICHRGTLSKICVYNRYNRSIYTYASIYRSKNDIESETDRVIGE